ncbi:MAG TPA: hypothetical protein EYG73_13265 [Arcobacter sp.]|nr:hypothetical protein [Arcobacter sp.]
MDKKYNLILSAVISISIYVLIILLFLLYVKTDKVKKYELVSKDTILELELVITKDEANDVKIVKSDIEKSVTKKIIKKSTATSAKKKSNLKSLFANISTKANQIHKKKVLNVKTTEVNSRFKSKYEKQKRNENITNSKLVDVKKEKSLKKKTLANNKGLYDEYYSKINNIILARWYKYPIFRENDYLLVAEIMIDSKGLFSYHITSYSGNLVVDNAVKEFLKNEKLKFYPIPPDGKKKRIRINFKPEIN